MTKLIKSEHEGIEFYTITSTGESGVSISGLGRLCGVDEKAIRRLIEMVRTSDKIPPKSFETFAGQELDLRTIAGERRQPGVPVVLRRDFCVTAISAYAKQGKQEAIFSLEKFAKIGFDQWVQTITGYKPNVQSSNDINSEVLLLLREQNKMIQNLTNKVEKLEQVQKDYSGIAYLTYEATLLKALPPTLVKRSFNIREYVRLRHGKILTKGECISFGKFAADTLRSFKFEEQIEYANRKIYTFKDIPGLDTAYKAWLEIKKGLL